MGSGSRFECAPSFVKSAKLLSGSVFFDVRVTL